MGKKISRRFIVLRLCVTAFLVCLLFLANAQQQQLMKQFNAYAEQTLQEKLYVHTDKNFYLTGEICWFKIYNVDGFFNKPIGISKIAYAELLDKNNKPVLQAKIAMKDGSGNGSVQLPVTLSSGKYLFRAYTRWMKNFDAGYFFEKPITIINPRKIYDGDTLHQKIKYDIQFFPEGGNMVNGIESKIAFRIVGQNGKGISCTGAIIDEKADTLLRFASLKFGMGNFLMKPEQGHSYKAILMLPDGYQTVQPLRAAEGKGYVMHLEKANDLQLKISVQSSAENESSQIFLFAHTRGLIKEVMTAESKNGRAVFFIDTAKLGAGISHFTVFNSNRQPVCERLYFKKPAQTLDIKMVTDLSLYDPRKKVNISITAADRNGIAANADMSLSVYKIDSLTMPDDNDICSYLWLSSDLMGNIESSGYYFSDNSSETAEATDNLMLTQGWRRFRWEDILQNKKPAFEFTPEYKGHIINGKVVSNVNGQPEKMAESFISVPGTRTQMRGTFSNDSGLVKFEMNNFYGNNEVIVQTGGENPGTKHVELANAFSDKFSATILPPFLIPEANADVLLNRNVSVQVQNNYAGNKLKQFTLPDIDTFPFYVKPDKTYLLDDYVRFTTVEEILREYVPEVNVRKRDGKYYLPVFDNARLEFFLVDPLILLDGLPVLDADKIMSYDPLKIRKLEVVARLYFYGSMVYGGIVNFVTYNGDLPGYELEQSATVIDYETLQMQREFFSPVYETQEQFQTRMPDFRNLLYWNPSVVTGKNGKKEINFYTSDVPGKYAVVLQGINAGGKAGSKTIFFDVNTKDSFAKKN